MRLSIIMGLGSLVAILVFGSMPVLAAEQNAFLNFDDGAITGNATVSGYEDQIVIQSLTYNVRQAGEWEEGEEVTGRVTAFGEFTVVKVMDRAHPALMVASAKKTQYKKAEINLLAGTDAYLTVTLEKVIVTGVTVGYSAGDSRPTEVVTLSFRKAIWRYGTATTSYDLSSRE